jgi:hypothetical protein
MLKQDEIGVLPSLPHWGVAAESLLSPKNKRDWGFCRQVLFSGEIRYRRFAVHISSSDPRQDAGCVCPSIHTKIYILVIDFNGPIFVRLDIHNTLFVIHHLPTRFSLLNVALYWLTSVESLAMGGCGFDVHPLYRLG